MVGHLNSINKQEALRYLGGESKAISDEWSIKLDQAIKDIINTAHPRWHSQRFCNKDLHNILVGKDILKLLEGCDECLLFCATLGSEIEQFLRLTQVSDMAYAVILDACSSAAIEQVCDDSQIMLSDQYNDKGLFLTSRFSCGYGDLPLHVQNNIISLLDAPRKIGLSVNNGGLLIPTKSVTAIMGISPIPLKNQSASCSTCNLKETCQFRKRGVPCGK